MNSTFSFTKEKTEYVKGIAILLMLFHHFFGFPEWYTEGISYIGIPLRVNTLEYVLGRFSHICVALFAFVTGYGMFFSYKSGSIFKKSVKRGISFLTGYWLVLFGVAIPINLALGKTDITPVFILKNMFAVDNTLVSFAWYVRFYLALLVTLPMFYKMMSRRPAITLPLFLLIPACCNILISQISSSDPRVAACTYFASEYFLWVTCALVGLCFAGYNFFRVFDTLSRHLGKLKLPFCIAVTAVLAFCRAYYSEAIGTFFTMDCIYAPIFVFLFCSITEHMPNILKSFLRVMSNHSMNLWFLHSVFFFRTSSLMKYAYFPKVSVLIVIWVIIILLPLSSALCSVQQLIMHRFKKRGHNKSAPDPFKEAERKIPQNI